MSQHFRLLILNFIVIIGLAFPVQASDEEYYDFDDGRLTFLDNPLDSLDDNDPVQIPTQLERPSHRPVHRPILGPRAPQHVRRLGPPPPTDILDIPQGPSILRKRPRALRTPRPSGSPPEDFLDEFTARKEPASKRLRTNDGGIAPVFPPPPPPTTSTPRRQDQFGFLASSVDSHPSVSTRALTLPGHHQRLQPPRISSEQAKILFAKMKRMKQLPRTSGRRKTRQSNGHPFDLRPKSRSRPRRPQSKRTQSASVKVVRQPVGMGRNTSSSSSASKDRGGESATSTRRSLKDIIRKQNEDTLRKRRQKAQFPVKRRPKLKISRRKSYFSSSSDSSSSEESDEEELNTSYSLKKTQRTPVARPKPSPPTHSSGEQDESSSSSSSSDSSSSEDRDSDENEEEEDDSPFIRAQPPKTRSATRTAQARTPSPKRVQRRAASPISFTPRGVTSPKVTSKRRFIIQLKRPQASKTTPPPKKRAQRQQKRAHLTTPVVSSIPQQKQLSKREKRALQRKIRVQRDIFAQFSPPPQTRSVRNKKNPPLSPNTRTPSPQRVQRKVPSPVASPAPIMQQKRSPLVKAAPRSPMQMRGVQSTRQPALSVTQERTPPPKKRAQRLKKKAPPIAVLASNLQPKKPPSRAELRQIHKEQQFKKLQERLFEHFALLKKAKVAQSREDSEEDEDDDEEEEEYSSSSSSEESEEEDEEEEEDNPPIKKLARLSKTKKFAFEKWFNSQSNRRFSTLTLKQKRAFYTGFLESQSASKSTQQNKKWRYNALRNLARAKLSGKRRRTTLKRERKYKATRPLRDRQKRRQKARDHQNQRSIDILQKVREGEDPFLQRLRAEVLTIRSQKIVGRAPLQKRLKKKNINATPQQIDAVLIDLVENGEIVMVRRSSHKDVEALKRIVKKIVKSSPSHEISKKDIDLAVQRTIPNKKIRDGAIMNAINLLVRNKEIRRIRRGFYTTPDTLEDEDEEDDLLSVSSSEESTGEEDDDDLDLLPPKNRQHRRGKGRPKATISQEDKNLIDSVLSKHLDWGAQQISKQPGMPPFRVTDNYIEALKRQGEISNVKRGTKRTWTEDDKETTRICRITNDWSAKRISEEEFQGRLSPPVVASILRILKNEEKVSRAPIKRKRTGDQKIRLRHYILEKEVSVRVAHRALFQGQHSLDTSKTMAKEDKSEGKLPQLITKKSIQAWKQSRRTQRRTQRRWYHGDTEEEEEEEVEEIEYSDPGPSEESEEEEEAPRRSSKKKKRKKRMS